MEVAERFRAHAGRILQVLVHMPALDGDAYNCVVPVRDRGSCNDDVPDASLKLRTPEDDKQGEGDDRSW